MAKKRPTYTPEEVERLRKASLFDKTEIVPPEAPDAVAVLSIGLKRSERVLLQQMADELGVTRHALLVYVVRDFIKRWEAGERPRVRSKVVLDL